MPLWVVCHFVCFSGFGRGTDAHQFCCSLLTHPKPFSWQAVVDTCFRNSLSGAGWGLKVGLPLLSAFASMSFCAGRVRWALSTEHSFCLSVCVDGSSKLSTDCSCLILRHTLLHLTQSFKPPKELVIHNPQVLPPTSAFCKCPVNAGAESHPHLPGWPWLNLLWTQAESLPFTYNKPAELSQGFKRDN